MVGKWHLGFARPSDTPLARGFDTYFGFLGGGEDSFTHCTDTSSDRATCNGYLDLRDGTSPEWGATGACSTELFANKTIALLSEHASSQGSDGGAAPLFLYLALQSVHEPLEVPDAWVDQYAWVQDASRRTMLAMVTYMDEQIRRVVEEGFMG